MIMGTKLIVIILVAAAISAFFIIGNIFPSNSITSGINSNDSDNNGKSNNNNGNTTKVVILTFSDSSKTQYANARPILNGYGLKGTFFITCTLVAPANKSPSMTWQNIATMKNERHDIQSGAMTYAPLTNLSKTRLDYEVQQSKQCLSNHGIEPTVFRIPFGRSWDNSTVINATAKHYNFAVNGFSNLMYLHCDGWQQRYVQQQQQQQDCRTYLQGGSLTFANRYSIREWNHNTFDVKYSHDYTKLFSAFVDELKKQTTYNYNGKITAVPIIAYHNIDNRKQPNSTDVKLFADEMKYLHNNGFKVITMADLTYDQDKNFITVKGLS
jgi:peptidoglycan/xylan/chitin deacetylase (PgdA/CDA1 family)